MALALGSWLRAPPSVLPSIVNTVSEESSERQDMDVVELSGPRFSNVPYAPSNPETLNPRLIQTQVKPAKFWRPQRGWGKGYKKPTAQQSMMGSILGAVCSVGVFEAVTVLHDHLSAHPLAQNVPFGLTHDVNQALETTVVGLGWLAISLFAASSVGLALLSVKLWAASSSEASKRTKSTAALLVALFCAASNVQEALSSTASEMFNRSCMGCHVQGGNILQPGARKISKIDDIFRITYYGKGRMPGFGEGCKPRGQCTFMSRLSDQDIQALAEFVKSQADQRWPNPPE